MIRRHTAVQQPGSARREVAAAGILHNDVVNASLIVGVTPAIPPSATNPHGQPQTAHFCSSRVLDPVILQEGDGQPVPSHDDYEVRISGGLPAVTRPCIMMLRAEICPNGVITVKHRTKKVRVVPVPECMLASRPWAYANGPQEVAQAYGCASVQQMVDTVGEELLIS